MDKMKRILFTVFIAVVVFCQSGDALRCYTCEQSPVVCRNNVTCTPEDDVCLQIRDFCNKSPDFLVASSAALSILAVTVLWMVYP